jgi:hypothetical protein
MPHLINTLILTCCLTSCFDRDNKPVTVDNDIQQSVSGKDVIERKEERYLITASTCPFDNPDTSLSHIKLRDAESAVMELKIKKLNGDTTYNFSTSDKKQILSTTVHPGDYYSQVSIFKVKYANIKNSKATPLSIDHFATEKNIRLGLTKNKVISILGNCYSAGDSTSKGITINYRLESPQDSRTKFLERQNMPIYFATYIFRNDKLTEFEFGFEYP